MLRSSLAVLTIAAVAGCSESAKIQNPFVSGGSNEAMLAAYAANSRFPATQPSSDLPVTALIDHSGNINVVNASDKPINDARVWINREFVTHVVSIPAHSTVTLSRNMFYNGQGQTLADVKTSPLTVQIDTGNGLYNLQGPAWD